MRGKQAGQDPDHRALEQVVLRPGGVHGRRVGEDGRQVRVLAGGRDLREVGRQLTLPVGGVLSGLPLLDLGLRG